MTDRDFSPDELVAALDAFMRDRQLETKGAAIRVLVTDMLEQLGYLPVGAARNEPLEEPVYRSSNGDEWRLSKNAAGSITVIHLANASSGGMETAMPVDQFLSQNKGSPEGQAVRAAVNGDVTPLTAPSVKI